MRNEYVVSQRRLSWDPLRYSAVLAVAYLSMLLCWDLLKNQGSMFQAVFTSIWGLGMLSTVIFVHALLQATYRELTSAFSALFGTVFFVALVVLSFSYMYAAQGVCLVQDNLADCLYYSVAVMTTLNEVAINETISANAKLYSVWQVLLGMFLFLLLLVQMVTLTQEYKRLNREIA